jgi:transposase
MWTDKNRARYDRSRLRYPGDVTDEEWTLIAPLIPPAKRGGNKRTVNLREIVNGLMYILSVGCQWRAIPKDLPPRSTLHDYFDLWNWDGRSIGFITPFMPNAVNERSARLPCRRDHRQPEREKRRKGGGLHRPARL